MTILTFPNNPSSSLTLPDDESNLLMTTALGSADNLPRVDRWISEISKAYQKFQQANQRCEKALKQLQPKINALPAAEKLSKLLEFGRGPEGRAIHQTEAEFIKTLLSAFKDPPLSRAIFGEGAKHYNLGITALVWGQSINDASQLTINPEALGTLIRKIEAGITITDLDDFFNVIQTQGDLTSDDSSLNRDRVEAKDLPNIPGFSVDPAKSRTRLEPFGDRSIRDSFQSSPVKEDDSAKIRMLTLIPPLLRPLKTDLKIPGRARWEPGRSWTQISRNANPGDPLATPQSAEDWQILIPILPSVAPGVRLPSLAFAPALGSLAFAPVSFILMFSGTKSLSKHPSLSEQML